MYIHDPVQRNDTRSGCTCTCDKVDFRCAATEVSVKSHGEEVKCVTIRVKCFDKVLHFVFVWLLFYFQQAKFMRMSAWPR